MLLIGQYDSGFVRRVGIALRWYGHVFEHRPHSVFRDGEVIAQHSPLRKVPVLVMDDGMVFTDSTICLEVLDGRFAAQQGEDASRLLLPRRGPSREVGLRVVGYAAGVLEKAVALVYERVLRDAPTAFWQDRCRVQLLETLALLERERSAQHTPYWLGPALSHADVAVTCAMTFVRDAHPGWLEAESLPALAALAAKCEALPDFQAIYQPFVVNC